VSIEGECIEKVCKETMAAYENIISKAIQDRIGDFKIEDLVDRMKRVIIQNENENEREVYYLDNEPLVTFTETDVKRVDNVLHYGFKYAIYGEGDT